MSEIREKKDMQIQALHETFGSNKSFYLLDFVKIPVAKSQALRKKLRENNCSLKVVKNRLALRALLEDLPKEIAGDFQGPTAIAFTDENPILLARLLKEFSTQHKTLKVKAGVVEGDYLHKDRFLEIAVLTSRLDLVAKLGYLMAYPLTQFLRSLRAPINTLGSMMSQLKEKKE